MHNIVESINLNDDDDDDDDDVDACVNDEDNLFCIQLVLHLHKSARDLKIQKPKHNRKTVKDEHS